MIEARGLRKAYGRREGLAGVDLDVPRGTVTALLGPNGAGKTTTVRILGTLARPDAGSARVGGHDVVRERSQVRRLIGLTGQAAAVDDLQTGRENLRTAARLAGLPAAAARRRAGELLERFHLVEAADPVVSRWSGGMRRRIDLAAGLVAAPAVLFLDEPTTGLDPRSRLVLWEGVTGLVAEGTTVLLTTQYLDEADRLADEVGVLDHGRVVARGTPAALKQQVSSLRLELQLTDADALAAVRTALGERVTRADEGALTLETGTDGSASAVRSLLDEVDPRARLVTRFAVHGASLDDVFLALTGPAAAPTETEHARV